MDLRGTLGVNFLNHVANPKFRSMDLRGTLDLKF